MAKKFLDLKPSEQLASLTTLRQDEMGDQIIQTTIVNNVQLSDDPGYANLQIGRASKGSVRPVINEDGSISLRVRPFQQATAQNVATETIHATEHGRFYRTSRKARIVFEFPLNATFSQISDALDDECYELRRYLDHPAS